jgi:hypothetical protein
MVIAVSTPRRSCTPASVPSGTCQHSTRTVPRSATTAGAGDRTRRVFHPWTRSSDSMFATTSAGLGCATDGTAGRAETPSPRSARVPCRGRSGRGRAFARAGAPPDSAALRSEGATDGAAPAAGTARGPTGPAGCPRRRPSRRGRSRWCRSSTPVAAANASSITAAAGPGSGPPGRTQDRGAPGLVFLGREARDRPLGERAALVRVSCRDLTRHHALDQPLQVPAPVLLHRLEAHESVTAGRDVVGECLESDLRQEHRPDEVSHLFLPLLGACATVAVRSHELYVPAGQRRQV